MDEPPLRHINHGNLGANEEDIVYNLEELQKSDAGLMGFWLGWGDDEFIPHDDDWERTGRCIGRHTRLEELYFAGLENVAVEHLKLLCNGVCLNKSIKHISFEDLGLDLARELIGDLAPFFANSPKLDYLTFNHCGIDPETIRCMMQTCPSNSYLYIEMENIDGGDTHAGDIIKALFQDPTLVYSLSYSSSDVGITGCMSIADVLQDSRCRLSLLDLADNDLPDEGLVAISVALAGGNGKLEELTLTGNQTITPVGWQALFTLLQGARCSLREVHLDRVSFTDELIISLANSLGRNCSLRELHLSDNPRVSEAGWRALSAVLERPECVLEVLNLRANSLNDHSLEAFARSLVGNSRLRNLELGENREVVIAAGLQAFCQPFQSEATALERVYFSAPDAAIHGAVADIAASLASNRKLKNLILGGITESQTSDLVQRVVDEVVCNKSSILSTYLSNHTLESIGFYGLTDTNLGMNYEKDKKKVARRKIMKVHFQGGIDNTNIQQFADIKPGVLPHVIAWMTRRYTISKENDSFSLLYQFVQNMPSLFGVKDRSVAVDEPRKIPRKRRRTW